MLQHIHVDDRISRYVMSLLNYRYSYGLHLIEDIIILIATDYIHMGLDVTGQG